MARMRVMRLRVGFPSDCVAGDLAASDLECVFVRVFSVNQETESEAAMLPLMLHSASSVVT